MQHGARLQALHADVADAAAAGARERSTDARRTGAIWGTAIGAGLAALCGALWVAGEVLVGSGSDALTRALPLGVLPGACAGAALGAVLGALAAPFFGSADEAGSDLRCNDTGDAEAESAAWRSTGGSVQDGATTEPPLYAWELPPGTRSAGRR